MVKGLGTVVYFVADLDQAKSWYTDAFQQAPYFDTPYYVGFNIAGYELGLHPDPPLGYTGCGGPISYWRVGDIAEAIRHFTSHGAKVADDVQDVGGGIKVATVTDPFGNAIGLIENPHFSLPAAQN